MFGKLGCQVRRQHVGHVARFLMRPIGLVTGLIVLALPLAPAVAAPTRISIPIDSTAPSPLLTSACGFNVSITQVGMLKATVFHDQSGAIIRELDTQPGTQVIRELVGDWQDFRVSVFLGVSSSNIRTGRPREARPS